MQGLSNQASPWNRPPPGRVQVIGFVLIALWLVAAFAVTSCVVSVAKSTRESRIETSDN